MTLAPDSSACSQLLAARLNDAGARVAADGVVMSAQNLDRGPSSRGRAPVYPSIDQLQPDVAPQPSQA